MRTLYMVILVLCISFVVVNAQIEIAKADLDTVSRAVQLVEHRIDSVYVSDYFPGETKTHEIQMGVLNLVGAVQDINRKYNNSVIFTPIFKSLIKRVEHRNDLTDFQKDQIRVRIEYWSTVLEAQVSFYNFPHF